MKLKPGIWPGVPFEEYQQWPAINDSFLSDLVMLTPAHAKCNRESPKETAALTIGDALHTRLLEPDKFNERFAMHPDCDRRTKEGKAIYQSFLDNIGNRQELTHDECDLIEMMANSMENKTFHQYIEKGQAEVCIVWKDPITKLLCKARLDYLQKQLSCIIDLKTTIKYATEDKFGWEMFRYQYDQKAAFYCDGLKELTGEMYAFVFFVLEKFPPYECRAFETQTETIIAGRKLYRKALKIYQQCLKTKIWPGYPDRVELINLPQAALNLRGVGKYNLITEDEENGTGQKYGGSIETDWEQLEREAKEAEGV